MLLVNIFSMILRLGELAFACIVAGINGNYLHSVENSSSWDQARFIYTEVVAGISIIAAIIWLFPFSGSFIHWPIDLIISILWWVVFGLLVNFLNGTCGNVFNWNGISFRGTNTCAEWKAVIAFAFLSALCWLISTFLGVYWVHRRASPDVAPTHRRRWYRRSRI